MIFVVERGKPLTTSIDTDLIVIFHEGAYFQGLTVYENVEFGLKVSKLKERKDIRCDSLTKNLCRCLCSSIVRKHEIGSG